MTPRDLLWRDRFMAAVITTVLALAGCGEEEGTGPGSRPASVSITPGTLTFASINETHPLTATVRNASGSPLTGVMLSWRSSDSAVASVSPSGLVTARGNGTAFVSARVGDLADSVGLTVQQVPTGLSVGVPQHLDGTVGLPLFLDVTVVDALGTRVSGSSPSVTIGLESNDQGSVLTGPLTSDPVDGTATFDNLHITRAGRNFRISAAAGSLTGRSAPFTVELYFSFISIGNGMACGLAGSDAYCWGRNFTGGLGTGTVGHRSRPTLVTGGLSFHQVDAGSGSNVGGIKDGGGCGITAGGKAYCWGRNDSGQLGDGNQGTDSNGPVAVRGGIVFTIVQMGRDHSCGVDVVGLAHCWGSNQVGQLGIGTLGGSSDVPVPVATGLRFLVLRVGDIRTCGVSFAGATYCWGEGGHSPLAGQPFVTQPTLVGGGVPLLRVDPGTFLHLCGSTAFGQGYCWGQDFGAGELGNGVPGVNVATPTPVMGSHIWEFIGASGQYSCGLIQGGTAACWGQDFNGSLGQGTIGVRSSTPRPVVGGIVFDRLAVGHGTNCGIALNAQAYCWGAGSYGERGDGTMDLQMSEPVKVQAP